MGSHSCGAAPGPTFPRNDRAARTAVVREVFGGEVAMRRQGEWKRPRVCTVALR